MIKPDFTVVKLTPKCLLLTKCLLQKIVFENTTIQNAKNALNLHII